MSEARVDNLEALTLFRRALLKFAEIANVAIADAESEAVGTQHWLESEQRVRWAGAVRKSQELVSRCEEALRHKRIFKDSSGRTPSAVDEEKALVKAKRMREHAEERLENVRRYTPRLQREILLYKGQVQRLGTFIAADIPTAVAKLDKMVDLLQAYVNLTPTEATAPAMNLPAAEESKSEPSMDDHKPAGETNGSA